jgi:hypothetical protein
MPSAEHPKAFVESMRTSFIDSLLNLSSLQAGSQDWSRHYVILLVPRSCSINSLPGVLPRTVPHLTILPKVSDTSARGGDLGMRPWYLVYSSSLTRPRWIFQSSLSAVAAVCFPVFRRLLPSLHLLPDVIRGFVCRKWYDTCPPAVRQTYSICFRTWAFFASLLFQLEIAF